MENKEVSVLEKNFISAVIYVHNAEKRIGAFLKEIINVLGNNFQHSEIICVNDASDDESLRELKKVSGSAAAVSVSVINMSYFHGLELAMNAGMDMAVGDFVFEFDNTCFDFNNSVIMDIYHRALEGYDIVSASPDRKEKFSSGIFYRVFDRYAGLSHKMETESFRILSRRVINRIGSMNRTVLYRKAVYANSGLKTDNLKYAVVNEQKYYSDKKERNYRSGLAVDSLVLFTEIGYRFSVSMTVVMMLVSAFMLVYSLVTYLTRHPVEGWTTTILFLSVVFLGLFGILTVIVKYLQLLLDLLFKRKHYSFENIEKLTK